MEISVLGFNHSNTPVEIRGKLSMTREKLPEHLKNLNLVVPQAIILSTCNRVEFYFSGGEKERGNIVDYIELCSGMKQHVFSQYFYEYSGINAITHLFEVASGLDSMILGEYEILGQVKYVLEIIKNQGAVDYPVLKLLNDALRVGRKVRQETDISRNALSVSSVAMELALGKITDLSSCRVLVIGAGEAGKLVARAGRERGVINVTVISRSEKRATSIVKELKATWVTVMELDKEITQADLVISCTGAPHLVVKSTMVEEAMKKRPHKPLVIIDIAVPQDVEPKVREINNVFFYNIDDLNGILKNNYKLREKEVDAARMIVTRESIRFYSWWESFGSRKLIASLVNKGEIIKTAHLNKTLPRLKNITALEKTHIEDMASAIVAKLLHEPLMFLKNGPHKDGDNILVRKIFNLDTKDD